MQYPQNNSRTGNVVRGVGLYKPFKSAYVWIVVAALIPLTLNLVRGSDDKNIDIKKLQGQWNMYFLNVCEGDTARIKNLIPREILKYTMMIEGDNKITLQVQGIKWFEWKVKYDFKKNPVRFEYTLIDHLEKDKVNAGKGLLKLDGEDLIFHMSLNQEQPSNFMQGKGMRSVLIKCKKVK